MRLVLLAAFLVACSDYELRCDRAGPATMAEAQVPDDGCIDALCLDEIVASNHNLRVQPLTPGCPRSGKNGTCKDDYLILRNRSGRDQQIDEYTLIRDDITYAASRLKGALLLQDVLDAGGTIDRQEAIYVVPPGERALLIMERRDPRPDWVVPHDLGSAWGTVRLERLVDDRDCEIDHTYYPSLKATKVRVDTNGDGIPDTPANRDGDSDDDEQDRAWRRMDNGCPDGLEECWRVACPTYQHPEIGCDVNPP